MFNGYSRYILRIFAGNYVHRSRGRKLNYRHIKPIVLLLKDFTLLENVLNVDKNPAGFSATLLNIT